MGFGCLFTPLLLNDNGKQKREKGANTFEKIWKNFRARGVGSGEKMMIRGGGGKDFCRVHLANSKAAFGKLWIPQYCGSSYPTPPC